MWLSKKISQEKNKKTTFTAEVTNSGSSITAQSSNEHRDIKLIAPQGISYAPESGENCLLIKTEDEVAALGIPVKDKNLDEGEIMLYAGDASITLTKDGKIYLSGRVFINGVEY